VRSVNVASWIQSTGLHERARRPRVREIVVNART
jgi:hypothetical protein